MALPRRHCQRLWTPCGSRSFARGTLWASGKRELRGGSGRRFTLHAAIGSRGICADSLPSFLTEELRRGTPSWPAALQPPPHLAAVQGHNRPRLGLNTACAPAPLGSWGDRKSPHPVEEKEESGSFPLLGDPSASFQMWLSPPQRTPIGVMEEKGQPITSTSIVWRLPPLRGTRPWGVHSPCTNRFPRGPLCRVRRGRPSKGA
mgnify:CR=1 FL=1